MKYGVMSYKENSRFFNVGDYVQSLAARQFLPKVDELLNREELAEYNGDRLKLIMNGWFTHNAANWIPSRDIEPLFVSFHINNTAAPLMLSKRGVEYLKSCMPIGCRDQYTADLLSQNGISSFFTGCLTLTLDCYKVPDSEREDKIYIVDPLYGYVTPRKVTYDIRALIRSIYNGSIWKLGKRNRHLSKIFDKELLKSAIFINQELPSKRYSESEKFELAEDLLNKYARAKLVVTSRIHCALPCLAMGTPVIFINGFESFVDSCRFDGILDLFNRIDIDTRSGNFKANFPLEGKLNINTVVKNLEKHHELSNNLKSSCKNFVKN